MSDLKSRLIKSSRIEGTDTLTDSIFFKKADMVQTSVPMLNVALSGCIEGGLTSGHTMLAGPSKHFKTSFSLLMVSAYLERYNDAVLRFFDSEFGSPQSYFQTFGIDPERVVHTPVPNIESMKSDLVSQYESLKRGDRVITLIDSIGNAASKKEVDDAMDGKVVADMTRAKALKSLFRCITTQLTMKDLPLISINHTYKSQDMYPKDIVSGGTGAMYSANNVWVIGRRQEKEGTEITGYDFMIKIEKSRFAREGTVVPISVSFDGGIQRWSGLLEVGLETGHIVKPKNGWYTAVDTANGTDLFGKNFRKADTQNLEFWSTVFEKTDFLSAVQKRYSLIPPSISTK